MSEDLAEGPVEDRTTISDDRYDVVVIGSGLGGLTAAALLAREGRKVLVLEQGTGAGGYARAFRRGSYTFDPAIHVFAQGGSGELPDVLLRHLGVRDACRMMRINCMYEARFPDLTIRVPFGYEAVTEEFARHFPREADAIRRFFRLMERMQQEVHDLPPRLTLRELDGAVTRLPTFFQYGKATVANVLDEYFEDPRLKAACSSLWPYMGLPPSNLSFVTLATFMRVLADGAYACEGSFQSFADAFVTALERDGGRLALGQPVERIVLEDGRVRGVALADGRVIRAGTVISNADARQTFENLVGVEQLPPSFARRLRRMTPSLSAFVVFAATTLDMTQFNPAYETFVYRHWDHEDTHRAILAGEPGGMWANVPTILDRSIAPPGEQLVILSALAPYNIGRPWEAERQRYTERLLSAFEEVFPGLNDQLTFVENATPLTLERYARNAQGAAYGWENTPAQTGSKRSPHHTPIGGLYLAGHWTQPGSGALRVVVSGLHAAEMVMLDTAGRGISFAHHDLAPA